jgi:hypothetical protein
VAISEVPEDGKLPAGTIMFEVRQVRSGGASAMKNGHCVNDSPVRQTSDIVYTIGPDGTCTTRDVP